MAKMSGIHNRPDTGVECNYSALASLICDKCGWVNPDLKPEYVVRGCLNLRWNDDGSLSCIHGDETPCDLPDHTTIPTFVRLADLQKPE